jgi:uncharacterized membrane protein YraQ (UPF0718 family)
LNIIKITRKIFFVSIIFGLISANVLSITNAKFHDLLSGLLSQIPLTDFMSQSKSKKFQSIADENKRLRNQNKVFKQKNRLRKAKISKAHRISKRVALRTAKNVSLNVSSVVGEAIPYLGIGVILAVTASDVYAGCETIKDTNELLNLLDDEGLKAEETQVCGMKIPTKQQVKESIKNNIREFDEVIRFS